MAFYSNERRGKERCSIGQKQDGIGYQRISAIINRKKRT